MHLQCITITSPDLDIFTKIAVFLWGKNVSTTNLGSTIHYTYKSYNKYFRLCMVSEELRLNEIGLFLQYYRFVQSFIEIMPLFSIEKKCKRLQWIFCVLLYFFLIKYFHFSIIVSPSKGVNLSMNIYLNSFHLNLCQVMMILFEIDPMILEENQFACIAFSLSSLLKGIHVPSIRAQSKMSICSKDQCLQTQ